MGGLTKDLWFIFAHILILQNCIHKNLELLVSTTGQSYVFCTLSIVFSLGSSFLPFLKLNASYPHVDSLIFNGEES